MPKRKAETGMTLVEILVSLVIIGFIVTAVYNVFRFHNLMAAKQEETTRMQQELLTALVDMSEELRMCGFTPTGDNNDYGLIVFNGTEGTNSSSIRCTRGESVLNNSTNIIAYKLQASTNEILMYNSTDWPPIANNISDLSFEYYDIDGNKTSDMKEVRIVEINATAIPSAKRAALNIPSRNMHTRVWLRNIGL